MSQTVAHLPLLLDAFYRAPIEGHLQPLKAEVSTRRYYRFTRTTDVADSSAPRSLVVMQLPEEAPGGPALVQARAFIDMQRFLAQQGLPVPQIYTHDLDHGLMLLEDLGDETFEARLQARGPGQWSALYAQAIDLLVRMHSAGGPPFDPQRCVAFSKRYDAALLRWELDHFREWGLEARQGQLSAAERSELDQHFDALTAAIVALPLGLVHRDYQSRNLMWAPADRLTIIDFQDAFVGPAPYDLVALLCDSYVELSAALQSEMLDRYARARSYDAGQAAALRRGFRLISVQRKLKDAGRFVFVERVRHNPEYLRFYPGSLAYVARALDELPEFAALRAQLRRCLPDYPQA